jgi:hypothetical protein
MAYPIPETRRSRAPFVIVLGVIVIGAVAAYFLVLKPKNSTGTPATAKPSVTTRAAQSIPPKASGSPSTPGAGSAPAVGNQGTTPTSKPGSTTPPSTVPVEETFQIYEVKNPFVPLDNSAAGGGGSSSGGSSSGGSSTTSTVSGGTSTGGSSTGGSAASPAPGSQTSSTSPGTGTGSGGAVEPNQGTRVSMVDAPFTDGGRLVANVKVGSTVYKVGAGDTFADSFKVVSLDGSCGNFLFGDNQFSLCAGQEILK